MGLQIDRSVLRGELKENMPMSRYTTWRTGGNAEYCYHPADRQDLGLFLSMLPEYIPVTWIGFGSNLLVRDGGLTGVVISVSGILNTLVLTAETKIKTDVGQSCPKVARFSARKGLSGIEFLAGIPGTIGGALAMNAGAYGGEIWQCVDRVETINRKGEFRTFTKDDFEIGYRSVSLSPGEWFLSANLKLKKTDKEIVAKNIRNLLSARSVTQPLGQFSCGSVFRNPPNDYAARLIDSCGLKGKQIGGATVSDKHANFIINAAHASSADIEQLIQFVQDSVYERHNIQLIPEVRIIGEYAEKEGRN